MIKFNSVTKKFGNGTVAFENLSFETEAGSMALITGPSGSGKTTVMKLLVKEYEPTQGTIEFDNQPLDKFKSRQLPELRRKIGIVFQDYKLIEDLNIWENIALPLYIKKERQANIESRVTDLLRLVGLTDKALVFPKQLSGGEAQRISIARALATGPSVIFADEPTGNLDKETSLHILKLLQKINDLGTTILLASHDPLILESLDCQRIELDKTEDKTDEDKSNKDEEIEKTDNSTKKSNKKKKDEPKRENATDEEEENSTNKKSKTKIKTNKNKTSHSKKDKKQKASRFGQFLNKLIPSSQPKEKEKEGPKSDPSTSKSEDKKRKEDNSSQESDTSTTKKEIKSEKKS